MFKAASTPEHSTILQEQGELKFSDGNLSYAMSKRSAATLLTVSNGSDSLSAPVALAVGNGELGQTYLLKQNGVYSEGRLSYFTGLGALGVTPGQAMETDATLQQSLGTALDSTEAARCFACHTTASTVSGRFDPDHATPGIGCEACHGPGVVHILEVKRGSKQGSKQGIEQPRDEALPKILNPERLSPVDSVDFCGACHRTPVDVALHMSDHLGIVSIRFQPYRLERSLCWGVAGDPRITCMACHDPHKPLVKDTASYDQNCLQCHAVAGRPALAKAAPACTIASRDCASCHMPRYELVPAHTSFTDHYIRIVRPGSGFRE